MYFLSCEEIKTTIKDYYKDYYKHKIKENPVKSNTT